MAYITAQEVKEIRNNLKTEFPAKAGWKFSVRKRNSSTLCVTVLQAPLNLIPKNHEGSAYAGVNHYHMSGSFESIEAEMYVKKIVNICNEKNFDKSDSQSDYFHVGYWFSMQIGQWDKPFERVA